MEINQLETFLQIVKTGSYSNASRNLCITQPAVSHQVKNLEKELNIKIFERIGNKMKLTEVGKYLVDAATKFLDDLDNLKRICENVRSLKEGHLTIATTNACLVYILPNIIKRFRKEFPRIKFKFISRGSFKDILPIIENNETDLAIGAHRDEKAKDLTFLLWESFRRMLVVPKHYSWHKKKVIQLADIGRLPLILPREGSVTRKAIDDAFARKQIPNKIVMETEEHSKIFAQMGFGAAIILSFTLDPDDNNRYRSIDVSHLFGKADYGIYYKKDKYITPAMKEFVRFFMSTQWRESRNLQLSNT
jgi:DNA-binding transcriptional LysR family regulator